MPKKIRELKSLLLKVGFIYRPGKGSHSIWSHPIIAGKDGSDARLYLEKQVNEALENLKKFEDKETKE